MHFPGERVPNASDYQPAVAVRDSRLNIRKGPNDLVARIEVSARLENINVPFEQTAIHVRSRGRVVFLRFKERHHEIISLYRNMNHLPLLSFLTPFIQPPAVQKAPVSSLTSPEHRFSW